MKIRTLEELNSALSKDFVWRKKELSQIKYMLETEGIPKEKKKVLFRSSIAIIYAHWEGFLKKSGERYLEYIASKRLKNYQLSENFLTISLCETVNIFQPSKKYSSFFKVVEFFNFKMNNNAKIPSNKIIDTESNLSSKVLKEIIWCLNLSYEGFEIKEKIIDNKLLRKRNFIAHGEEIETDENEIKYLKDEILNLMTLFKNKIENSAYSQSFQIN